MHKAERCQIAMTSTRARGISVQGKLCVHVCVVVPLGPSPGEEGGKAESACMCAHSSRAGVGAHHEYIANAKVSLIIRKRQLMLENILRILNTFISKQNALKPTSTCGTCHPRLPSQHELEQIEEVEQV